MRIPIIQGIIRRRMLINFRANPAVVRKLLPQPFEPKLHGRFAIVGVCLIRLEQIRPAGLPGLIGISSENAAHRVAVEWNDETGARREGVFIPRRDTGSLLNRVAGGRIFPGEHHGADFSVTDEAGHIDFAMQSLDGEVCVKVAGEETDSFPAASCFGSLLEASAFFEGGSLGYSVKRDGNRMDGLLLRTLEWRVRALAVKEIQSSYFADEARFPKGSVHFDHALIMRNLTHEWHQAADLNSVPRQTP